MRGRLGGGVSLKIAPGMRCISDSDIEETEEERSMEGSVGGGGAKEEEEQRETISG